MKKIISIFILLGMIELQADDFTYGTKAYLITTKKLLNFIRSLVMQENSMSCVSLGVLYNNSQGVKQNYFKATKFYEKTYKAGDPSSYRHNHI